MKRDFDKKVGAILRERRIDKRMTQLQLAEMLGVPESTYGCWETGHRGMNIDTFFEVCQILGLKPNDIQKQLMR